MLMNRSVLSVVSLVPWFDKQVWLTSAEDIILSKLLWYKMSPVLERQLQDVLEVYEIQSNAPPPLPPVPARTTIRLPLGAPAKKRTRVRWARLRPRVLHHPDQVDAIIFDHRDDRAVAQFS